MREAGNVISLLALVALLAAGPGRRGAERGARTSVRAIAHTSCGCRPRRRAATSRN